MSATHSGSTPPGYLSHLKLAVPVRSTGVSKSIVASRHSVSEARPRCVASRA